MVLYIVLYLHHTKTLNIEQQLVTLHTITTYTSLGGISYANKNDAIRSSKQHLWEQEQIKAGLKEWGRSNKYCEIKYFNKNILKEVHGFIIGINYDNVIICHDDKLNGLYLGNTQISLFTGKVFVK